MVFIEHLGLYRSIRWLNHMKLKPATFTSVAMRRRKCCLSMARPYFVLPAFVMPSFRSELVLQLEIELQLKLGLQLVHQLNPRLVLDVFQPKQLLPLAREVGAGWQDCFRMRLSLVCVFV